jgi:hypothetical protein
MKRPHVETIYGKYTQALDSNSRTLQNLFNRARLRRAEFTDRDSDKP